MTDSLNDQIAVLLQRKHDIDGMVMDRFTETQRWLAESVEFLLHAIVDLQQRMDR